MTNKENKKIQLKIADFLNKDDFLELSHNKKVGFFGQQIAKQYLFSLDYEVLSENYYIRGGEIDLVMRKYGHVMLVEVKTRTSKELGEPFESIGPNKKIRMRKAAYVFMKDKGWLENTLFQLDVVSIYIDCENNTVWLRHFQNIE